MAKPRSKLPVVVDYAAADPEDGVSRREFVGTVTWSAVAAALAACGGGGNGGVTPPGGGGGGGGGGSDLPAGVTVNGNVITIALSQQPGLAAVNGFLLIPQAQAKTFVINLGASGFRAFTSICTHEGCDVNNFSGGTINCPCHGSQYNTAGQVVAGPAPSPLQEFTTAFNASTNTLTITK